MKKNHTVLMVRWQSRRGGELLHCNLSELKDCELDTLWRGRTRTERIGHVRDLQTAGTRVHRIERRPMFKFSPAISFFVHCETQEEVDHFWEKLSEGGEKQKCGWLRDKFGVSRQVVPTVLSQIAGKPGCREIEASYECHAANGQARHRKSEESKRATIK